jgi:RNA polymerase primary sigma factor
MSNKQIYINQDEIAFYLKDVRTKTVLTPKREKELAKIMLNPDSTEEEKEKVHTELLEGNLRFVISVAKDYQGQGVDLADLIAEGNYGLLKAMKNFDWSKGFRFISYAVWWVKQSILQCLNENARTIRLPVNIIQELHREKKKADNGITEMSSKLAMLPTTIRYDKPINEEGDRLLDIIPDNGAESPDKLIDDNANLKIQLNLLMRCLDDRETEIIRRYHGLDYSPHTLQEIGDVFGLTKERVRQIKEKALRKLRNDSYSLLDYLTE